MLLVSWNFTQLTFNMTSFHSVTMTLEPFLFCVSCVFCRETTQRLSKHKQSLVVLVKRSLGLINWMINHLFYWFTWHYHQPLLCYYFSNFNHYCLQFNLTMYLKLSYHCQQLLYYFSQFDCHCHRQELYWLSYFKLSLFKSYQRQYYCRYQSC